MSCLLGDFGDKERINCLEKEIIRLQDLCRTNFAVIDNLKKENLKLSEVQTELKETTSDLAYSLAEYPWWGKENMPTVIKILAEFTQKVQYILELPTFIDPVEQLEKNGGFHRRLVAKILNRKSTNKISRSYFKCKRCKKLYTLERNFKKHTILHRNFTRKICCKICGQKFHPYFLLKRHKADCSQSYVHDFDSQFDSSLQNSQNSLKIQRFLKCSKCDASLYSPCAFQRHQQFCRKSPITKGMNISQRLNPGSEGQSQANDGRSSTIVSSGLLTGSIRTNTNPNLTCDASGDDNSTENIHGIRSIGQKLSVISKMLPIELFIPLVPQGTSTAENTSSMDTEGNQMADKIEAKQSELSTAHFVKNHKITRHNGFSEYSCIECDVSFLENQQLQAHMRIHTIKKPFQCNVCQNTFLDQHNLESHSLTHMIEYHRPVDKKEDTQINQTKSNPTIYQCDLCEFSADVRNTLSSHKTSNCPKKDCLLNEVSFIKDIQSEDVAESEAVSTASVSDSTVQDQLSDSGQIGVHMALRHRSATL